MSEPTPRQILYALVSGGFLAVVLALVIGAAVAGLVPLWWTVVMASFLAISVAYAAVNWRRTAAVLLISIGAFIVWMVGTLIVA